MVINSLRVFIISVCSFIAFIFLRVSMSITPYSTFEYSELKEIFVSFIFGLIPIGIGLFAGTLLVGLVCQVTKEIDKYVNNK